MIYQAISLEAFGGSAKDKGKVLLSVNCFFVSFSFRILKNNPNEFLLKRYFCIGCSRLVRFCTSKYNGNIGTVFNKNTNDSAIIEESRQI